MILKAHLQLWREIFGLRYLPLGSWLTIGFQDIHPSARTEEGFRFPNVGELLASRGIQVTTLDFFDERADLKFDLNLPVPPKHHGQFDMLLDIGSIEHVYDTRQAVINYLAMVKVGGYLCLHTPVSGYYGHGLHTFSPEAIRKSLTGNGCVITYERFSSSKGKVLQESELKNQNALIWILAQKKSKVGKFVNPQQARWTKGKRL